MSATSDETRAKTSSLSLRPDSRAPRIARRLVRHCCAGSGLPARTVDDAIFLAGEIVTAGIRHGRRNVEFCVEVEAAQILVRIRASPAGRPTDLTEWETSRCIAVIKRLSSSYGLAWDGRRRDNLGLPAKLTPPGAYRSRAAQLPPGPLSCREVRLCSGSRRAGTSSTPCRCPRCSHRCR